MKIIVAIAAALMMSSSARADSAALKQAAGAAEKSRQAAVSQSGTEAKAEAGKAMGESADASVVTAGEGATLSPTLPPAAKERTASAKADEKKGEVAPPSSSVKNSRPGRAWGEALKGIAGVVAGIALMTGVVVVLLALSAAAGPWAAIGVGIGLCAVMAIAGLASKG